jgi:hypothetical protein
LRKSIFYSCATPFIHEGLDFKGNPQITLRVANTIIKKNDPITDDRESSVVAICSAYIAWVNRIPRNNDYVSGRDGGLTEYGETSYITMRKLITFLDGNDDFEKFLVSFRV